MQNDIALWNDRIFRYFHRSPTTLDLEDMLQKKIGTGCSIEWSGEGEMTLARGTEYPSIDAG